MEKIYVELMLLISLSAIIYLYIRPSGFDKVLFLQVALLSVAVLEPAPSDFLFIPLLLFAFRRQIFSGENLKRRLTILVVTVIFLAINLLGLYQAAFSNQEIRFFVITFYLIAYGWLIGMYTQPAKQLLLIRAYLISSSVAAILGVTGYFGHFSVLTFDSYRAMALFKDPNVFGPFLVPSIILLIDDLLNQQPVFKSKSGHYALLAIHSLALTISFSRGAWVNALLALSVYFLLNLRRFHLKKLLIGFGCFLFIVILIWSLWLPAQWKEFFLDRSQIQLYDSDRFATQKEGLSLAFQRFFGFGPGGYEEAVAYTHGSRSAHNSFIRVLVENGAFGFLLFIVPLFFLAVKMLRLYLQKRDSGWIRSGTLVAIYSGLLVNSLVVDTLHWRSLWFFVGIGFSLYVNHSDEILKARWTNRLKGSENALEMQIIREFDQLYPLKSAWDQILEANHNNYPFLQLEWFTCWWQNCRTNEQLYVLVFEKEGKIVGFCPLMLLGRFGYHEVNFLGYPQTSNMDFILEDSHREECIIQALQHLSTHHFLVNLYGMDQKSPNLALCSTYLSSRKIPYLFSEQETWLIQMCHYPSFAELYKSRRKHNSVRNIPSYEKKLRELGTLVIEPLPPDEFEQIFELHEKEWRNKWDTSGLMDPQVQLFLKQLSVMGASSFGIKIDILRLNRRILAFQYGYKSNGRYVLYRTGYDPDFSVYAPGKLLVKETIAACFTPPGFEIFDFGTGFERYKKEWSDETIKVGRLIFSSPGLMPKLCFLKSCFTTQLVKQLKKNPRIIAFKRKNLGQIRYFFSRKHWRRLYQKWAYLLFTKGLNWTRLFEVPAKLIYYRRQYILWEKSLLQHHQAQIPAPYKIREATIDDLSAIAELMAAQPSLILKKFQNRQKCFLVENAAGSLISCCWINFTNIEIPDSLYSRELEPQAAFIGDESTVRKYQNQEFRNAVLEYITSYLYRNGYHLVYLITNKVRSRHWVPDTGFTPTSVITSVWLFNRIKTGISDGKVYTTTTGRKGLKPTVRIIYSLRIIFAKIVKLACLPFGILWAMFRPNKNEILILMYHRVNDEVIKEMAVKEKDFGWQMAYLKKVGARVISMDETCERIKNRQIDSRFVVLTFDDGYEDFLSGAFPMITRYGFPAIIYLVPEYIETGRIYPWDADIGESKLLSWPQILSLQTSGLISFGSHTANHLNLDMLTPVELERELQSSQAILDEKLGRKTEHFCYPRGKFSEQGAKLVRIYYNTGVLIGGGEPITAGADCNPLKLRRVPVQRSDGKFFFRARINGWLVLEEAIRKLKNWIRRS